MTLRGLYLNQQDAATAMGITTPTFSKYRVTLKQRSVKRGRVEYFLPEKMMTAKYRKYYADVMQELDDDAEEVESILGDVSDTADILTSSPSNELTEAKLDNLKARTALINEKLEQRKTELFSEWSEKFFEVFSNAFARFKNSLVELHLSEEQLSTLTDNLENALKSMNDGIEQINAEWMNEQNEEDKEV